MLARIRFSSPFAAGIDERTEYGWHTFDASVSPAPDGSDTVRAFRTIHAV